MILYKIHSVYPKEYWSTVSYGEVLKEIFIDDNKILIKQPIPDIGDDCAIVNRLKECLSSGHRGFLVDTGYGSKMVYLI